VSTARLEMEVSRNLRDPLRSSLGADRSEYAGRYGLLLRKANAAVEVGSADSTWSAGKPSTWGSGGADEDWT